MNSQKKINIDKLIFSCFLLLVGCNANQKEQTNLISHNETNWIRLSDSVNTISIHNPHCFPVKFTLKINDFFPLTMNEIKRLIPNLTNTDSISKQKAIWKFVINNTFYSKSYTSENWQHHPILFLNSIGGGLCDDHASVLSRLWEKNGFDSRIIGLAGHVVPEVYYKNKWHMYDPSLRVYYCNNNNNVLSIQQLETNANSFYNSNCKDTNIHSLLGNQKALIEYFAKLYTTEENNHNVTNWHLDYDKLSKWFVLPPKSSLFITHETTSGITSIRVKLTEKSNGMLQIPLVPIKGNGYFKISTNNTIIQVNEKNFQFPRQEFYHKMNILDVQEIGEIHYSINPKLNVFKTNNKIIIDADRKLLVTGIYSHEKPKILFGKSGFDFDRHPTEFNFDAIAKLLNQNTVNSKLFGY